MELLVDFDGVMTPYLLFPVVGSCDLDSWQGRLLLGELEVLRLIFWDWFGLSGLECFMCDLWNLRMT